MSIDTNLAEAIKGYIDFPCGCGKKILVYDNTGGKASSQCPKCGKYAVFNYDEMCAVPTKAARGAISNIKNNNRYH